MPMYAGVYTDHRHVCIGNHMISSAIWDKSPQEHFSKTNQFARASRASAICSLTYFRVLIYSKLHERIM